MAITDNAHFVTGERENSGLFLTVCPHKVIYEYINGYGYRMVGSAVCRSCKYYLEKNKNKVMCNEFSIKCGHPEGTEENQIQASKLKINF